VLDRQGWLVVDASPGPPLRSAGMTRCSSAGTSKLGRSVQLGRHGATRRGV